MKNIIILIGVSGSGKSALGKALSEKLGILFIDGDDFHSLDNIEKMIWHLDEPLADPAPLNVLYISNLAKERGMKVLLSGSGGDDLFTGYRRHLALRYENLWSWLPKKKRIGLENFSLKFDIHVPLQEVL